MIQNQIFANAFSYAIENCFKIQRKQDRRRNRREKKNENERNWHTTNRLPDATATAKDKNQEHGKCIAWRIVNVECEMRKSNETTTALSVAQTIAVIIIIIVVWSEEEFCTKHRDFSAGVCVCAKRR